MSSLLSNRGAPTPFRVTVIPLIAVLLTAASSPAARADADGVPPAILGELEGPRMQYKEVATCTPSQSRNSSSLVIAVDLFLSHPKAEKGTYTLSVLHEKSPPHEVYPMRARGLQSRVEKAGSDLVIAVAGDKTLRIHQSDLSALVSGTAHEVQAELIRGAPFPAEELTCVPPAEESE